MCRVGPLPVQREGEVLEAGQRAHLLLADVVRPAAAVDPLAAAQHEQGEEGPVDLVGVVPVVGARAHRDHRAAPRKLGVAGELAGDPGRGRGRHRGDRLLPGRGVRRGGVVVAGGPLAGQSVARHRVLRHQQVEDGGDQPAADAHRRDAAADDRAALGLADVEAGQVDRDRLLVPPVQAQQRVDPVQVEVPPALPRRCPPEAERAVGDVRLRRSPSRAARSCAPRPRPGRRRRRGRPR